MAKNSFPQTTLLPIQQIHFILSDKSRIVVQLFPKPDAAHATVADVALMVSIAGGFVLFPLPSLVTLSIVDAAKLAYQFALLQSRKLSLTVSSVELEGEEFVEMSDMAQIAPNGMSISVV